MTIDLSAAELPADGLADGLTDRLDMPPGLRVAANGYLAEFGGPPSTVWQVPGTLTLLSDGPLRLAVATPWTTIAAARPRPDDVIELAKMERPGERARLTVSEAVAGSGPEWAGTGLRSARQGATLLVKAELPEGSGVSAGVATETAVRLCLADVAGDMTGGPGGVPAGPGAACAMAGGRQVPLDLAAAGLRLVIIDTRARGVPRAAPGERSPVAALAEAMAAGDISALGPLLTAAHDAMDCDEEQQIAVAAALRAGALGARMITDGEGRPACALVPVARLAGLRAEVSAGFDRKGLRPPRFLTFTPACGPQRIWGG
jgi:galactokinase